MNLSHNMDKADSGGPLEMLFICISGMGHVS